MSKEGRAHGDALFLARPFVWGTRLVLAMHGEPQRGLVRLPCTLIVRESSQGLVKEP